MPWFALFYLLLTLNAVAAQSGSSFPTTSPKSSEIDSNLLLNDFDLIQGDFNFQDSSSEKSPKIPEKRNLTVTCQNGSNGCKTCSATDTSLCAVCDDSSATKPDINGGCTQTQIQNCAILESENTCSKCPDNYYMDCSFPCAAHTDTCITCKDYKTCAECPDSSILVNGYCMSCSNSKPDHCISCSTKAEACTLCVDGYTIDDVGQCTHATINKCEIISRSDPSTCVKCLSGFYWATTECKACSNANIGHCGICNTDGVNCDECDSGYYWSGSACVECSSFTVGCNACKMDGTCTACPMGTMPDSEGKCTVSALGHCDVVMNGDGSSCYKCSSGYGLDSDGKTCIVCGAGYYVSESGKCITSLLTNCDLLSNEVTCKICSSGYAKQCDACGKKMDNCKCSYNDGSFCMECNNGFVLTEAGTCSVACSKAHCTTCSADGSTCSKCDSGYLLNANGDCVSSNLLNCAITNLDGSQCNICSSGFLFDTANNCVSSNAQNCAIVDKNNNNVCNTCKSGFLFDITNKCISSTTPNCVKVETDGTKCNTCTASYLPDVRGVCVLSSLQNCVTVENNDGTKCNTCISNYKPDQAGKCYTCSSNCAACSSSTVCSQCKTNYFLYDNSGTTTCISCADSCSSCNPSPNCYNCASLIVQDGSSCRTDSVGYEMSFEDPYIILDFAHSTSKTYSIKSMTASHDDDSTKATTKWSISSRTSTQLKILTDNLDVSDLPINLVLTFI